MEVVGLCYFTVAILPQSNIKGDLCVLMMNGLFLAPVVWQIWEIQTGRRREEPGFQGRLITFIVASVIELVGLGVLTYKVQGLSRQQLCS